MRRYGNSKILLISGIITLIIFAVSILQFNFDPVNLLKQLIAESSRFDSRMIDRYLTVLVNYLFVTIVITLIFGKVAENRR